MKKEKSISKRIYILVGAIFLVILGIVNFMRFRSIYYIPFDDTYFILFWIMGLTFLITFLFYSARKLDSTVKIFSLVSFIALLLSYLIYELFFSVETRLQGSIITTCILFIGAFFGLYSFFKVL